MSTYETRLTALEKMMEVFQREEAMKIDNLNHNTTILLGIVSSQGFDIKEIKTRLDGIDHRLDGIDHRLDGIDHRLDGIDQRFDGIDRRLDGIDQHFTSLEGRFSSLEGRFDQMMQMLTTLVNKAEA